jgi:hypothetical protein
MRALISSTLAFAMALHADTDSEYCYGNPSLFGDKPCIRTFLYGEFFYASLSEEGLAYAIRSNSGSVLSGKFLEPPSPWRPGFRIGFGSHLSHDAWEVRADWTYFRNDIVKTAHASFAPPGSSYLIPTFIDAESFTQLIGFHSVQEAKEHWVCVFDTLFFALSRSYFLSQQLAIRPEVGLFAAWISQNIDISYRSGGAPVGVVSYQTGIENDTWRVGPSVGTKLDWYLRRKLALFGGVRAAACYRPLFFRQTQNSVGNSGGDFRISLAEHSRSVQPWLDLQLGLAWRSFIHRSRNFLEIALQYECQYFWHELASRTLYEQIPVSQDRNFSQFGDLSVQIAALSLRIDF